MAEENAAAAPPPGAAAEAAAQAPAPQGGTAGNPGNVQVDTGATPEEGVYARVGDKTFASAEELSKWYDAERQTGRPAEEGEEKAADTEVKADDAEKKDDDKPKVEATPEQIETIKANLKEAGGFYADPRYEAAAIEFETAGDVTPETRDKVAADFGITRDMVDAFIDGQQAQRQLAASTAENTNKAFADGLHEVVGGADTYDAFVKWGVDALSDTDRASYDRSLGLDPKTGERDPKGKPDLETAKALLKGFYDRYKAAGHGPGPRDLTTEAAAKDGGTSGAEGYASKAEMQKDMRSPEYQSSEEFRQKVAKRVAATTAF